MHYIHSIYLTGNKNEVLMLPQRIQSNIDSFKAVHPNCDHLLFTDENLRAFIAANFKPDVLKAYDELVPLAYKADLGRYCLLHYYGGIYSDVSVQFFNGLDNNLIDNRKLFIFRDSFSHAPWIVSTSLLYAQKNLPIFEYVIQSIVEHTKSGYYGYNPLCPTGPNLFGKALAQMMNLSEFMTGETIKVNKNPLTHSFAYLLPNGEVCAVNVKNGSGLASLGTKHNDNYNQHYENKTIYMNDLKQLQALEKNIYYQLKKQSKKIINKLIKLL